MSSCQRLRFFQTSHLAGAPHKYGFAREIQRTRLANTTQYVVTLLRCCRLDLLLLHSCGATAPPVTLSGCALFANLKLLLEFDRQGYPYSFYTGFCATSARLEFDTATVDRHICDYSFVLHAARLSDVCFFLFSITSHACTSALWASQRRRCSSTASWAQQRNIRSAAVSGDAKTTSPC